MSKPMTFRINKAFNFLDENGFVFTFRRGKYDKRVQDVWIRRSRNGRKQFDATKVTIKSEVNPDLSKYAEWSGFEDEVEWVNVIHGIHGKGLIEGTVYLVFKNEGGEDV